MGSAHAGHTQRLYAIRVSVVIQAFCPAQNSVSVDRKVARNPLLPLHSNVNNIKYTTIEKFLIFFNHIKKGMFLKSYYYNFLMDKVSLVIDLYDKSNYIGNKHYYNAKNPLTLQNKISPPIT